MIAVDSSFQVMRTKPYLIKNSQQDPARSCRGVSINRAVTSVRQLSPEWGMRQIQGQFPRLKGLLPYEEMGERKSHCKPSGLVNQPNTELIHQQDRRILLLQSGPSSRDRR